MKNIKRFFTAKIAVTQAFRLDFFKAKALSYTTIVLALLIISSGIVVAGDSPRGLSALPSNPPIPTDNPSGTNVYPSKMDKKQELGYLLFFDPKVSGDGSISCADCHDPKQGWGFADPISRGYPGTVHWRNSQTAVNSGYLNKIFWEGGTTSLESQAPAAAGGGVAGNGSPDMMESRLRFSPEYVKRFKEVFGLEWPNMDHAWDAIAAFERYLSQPDTPFDKFMRGDKNALASKAQKGMEIFKGKANCIACHNGPMLSDEKFYDIGVADAPEFEESGLQQVTVRFQHYSKGSSEEIYRTSKHDLGIYFKQKRLEDRGKFRIAPLRYLKYTAPYMHNGTLFTLDEVIEFYNKGGGEDRWGNKTKILKPLNLTKDEKEALKEFLLSTSGEEIRLPVPKVPDYAPMADWQPKK
ncbi:MAG: cytochrome-c peroxidase [Deltaproteobacteria bacterium]|nr:cytochrome-c peroxidase [Deltaproteobacteria bacterium]